MSEEDSAATVRFVPPPLPVPAGQKPFYLRAPTFIEEHHASRKGQAVSVSNVVASFTLGCQLSLTQLAIVLGGCLDRKCFTAAFLRNKAAHSTTSAFEGGHIVVMGCKSALHANATAQQLRYQVWKKMNVAVSVLNFRILNQVCRVELPYSIPSAAYPGEPMPPTGGVNIVMMKNDLEMHPLNVKGQHTPDTWKGFMWRVQLPNGGPLMSLTMFDRGRGSATNSKNAHDVAVFNDIIMSLPSFERGKEHRPMTADEVARVNMLEQSAIKKKKITAAKKKRKKDTTPSAGEEDDEEEEKRQRPPQPIPGGASVQAYIPPSPVSMDIDPLPAAAASLFSAAALFGSRS